MNLTALQATLRRFAADRDWQPFQTPKNLAMAMVVEAAELVEIFQWMTAEQSVLAYRDPVVQQHIGEEIADVLVYLLQIADHSQIDLPSAVQAKLLLNARKYPPKHAPGAKPLQAPMPAPAPTAAPAPAGRTHVLLDFENVQPDAEALRVLVPDLAQVWLFHGPHQKHPGRHLADLPLTLVPISKTGKNALDFHLTFYVGFISSRHPDDKIVVVANDQGYEPMLMHARAMGFDVRLQTLPVAPRKLTAAKKQAPTRKTAAAQAQTDKAPAEATAPAADGKSADKSAAKVKRKPVPAKKAANKKPSAAAAKKVATTPDAARRPAAKKKVAQAISVAAAAAAPAKAPASGPASGPARAPARTPTQAPPTAVAARTASKPIGKTVVKPAAQAKAAVASATVLQKLLANLRRAGDQRPATRAPLLRALLSWLGAGHTADEAAAALQQLADTGYLDVTPVGRVSYQL